MSRSFLTYNKVDIRCYNVYNSQIILLAKFLSKERLKMRVEAKSRHTRTHKRTVSLLLSILMALSLSTWLPLPGASAAPVDVLGAAGFGVSANTTSFAGANQISCSQGNSNWRLVENGVVGTASSVTYLGYTIGGNTTPGIDWYTIGNNNSYYLRFNLGSAKTVNKMVITCGVLYNLAG